VLIRKSFFSLLEVIMATTILSMVMVAVMLVMGSATRSIESEGDHIMSQQAAHHALSSIVESVRGAQILDLPGNQSNTITFISPVDHDGDGDVFDPAMEIEWGTEINGIQYKDLSNETPGSVQTFTETFFFEALEGAESFVNEAELNHDVNEDGDIQDMFVLGRVIRLLSGGTVVDTGEVVDPVQVAVTPFYVMQIAGQETGDVDGDGVLDDVDDGIFTLDGDTLTITLFMVKPGVEEPTMTKVQTSIGLRNP
jgi:type II secretory pathway pseudopilin PulG